MLSKATLNKQQYNNDYYQLNSEIINEKNKLYYKKNVEIIAEYKREYYLRNKKIINEKFKCECGGKYSKSNESNHIKTKKHLKYLKNQIDNSN